MGCNFPMEAAGRHWAQQGRVCLLLSTVSPCALQLSSLGFPCLPCPWPFVLGGLVVGGSKHLPGEVARSQFYKQVAQPRVGVTDPNSHGPLLCSTR